MEQIYTIPVNEAFEKTREDKLLGCPFCNLYNTLESSEIELILGASMMEPDIRQKTNEMGFCPTHFDLMMTRGKRLPLALILESHLLTIRENINKKGLFAATTGANSAKYLTDLDSSCYLCSRIDSAFDKMVETAVILWNSDDSFKEKVLDQPYYCIKHYGKYLTKAKERLDKKSFGNFYTKLSEMENAKLEKLNDDVSWFIKKFDYRYTDEPWNDAKDAIERSQKIIEGELHRKIEDKK